MHIIWNHVNNTVTFLPDSEAETAVVKTIATEAKPGEKLDYAGCDYEKENNRYNTFLEIYLHFRGNKVRVSEQLSPTCTFTTNKYVGGQRLTVRGSTKKDKELVNKIRATCYLGTSGLIFVDKVEVDEALGIICTGCYCKVCNKPIIDLSETEWKTCNACSAVCQHEYEYGIVHGGPKKIDIGVGEFCGKCGRGKTHTEDSKSLSQHHAAVAEEFGIGVFYKSDFPPPPRG